MLLVKPGKLLHELTTHVLFNLVDAVDLAMILKFFPSAFLVNLVTQSTHPFVFLVALVNCLLVPCQLRKGS